MKVVGINGSPRNNGNTAGYIKEAFKVFENEGFSTEFVQLGGNMVHGCTGCRKCAEKLNRQCIFNDDPINKCLEAMFESDAVLIGSPTYFGNLTAETKALLDRAGMVNKANGGLLNRKAGAAVVAVRRAGGMCVFNTINNFYLINGMIVPGSSYWNIGVSMAEGEYKEDEEGLTTIKKLAENISWLIKK
ncbi:MAG: flavodoxin family protein [Candidatus Muiribacteriota bacterium]